jgi:2,3-dihydroxy-2,3-dihydrophenylpropionate dehydrogenase
VGIVTGWLEGDVALVTGAGSGIGRAVALRFLQEGVAGVAVFERDAEKLQSTVDAAGIDASRVLPIVGDVRSSSDLEAAVDATVDRFGTLDVLVPNAGIWDFNHSVTSTTGQEIGDLYDELFDVNVKGYLLTVSAAWRALVSSGGNIVMTLSNSAFYAAGGGAVYTAAKHAARGLVLQLAYELAPKVRVNGVAIGGLRTDLRGPKSLGMGDRSIEMSFAKRDGKARSNAWLPLHDASTDPADSTGPYVLLASSRNASVITGTIINADGGIGVRGFATAAGGDDL